MTRLLVPARVAALYSVMLIAAGALAGCGSGGATGVASALATAATQPSVAVASSLSGSGSAGTSDAPAGPVIPDSPVAGIVVGVDSAGLDKVSGFTLRTNDGETIVFKIGTLENGDEFPPGHLKEHQTTAAPVLVFFKQENGALVVFRIEDAG